MMNKVVCAAVAAVASSALFAVVTENTYARVQVQQNTKSMIVAVPVTSATDGSDVDVTDLIMPFSLQSGDSIQKWNGTKYVGWKWTGSAWEVETAVVAGEDAGAQAEAPAEGSALARGTAFWFNRANPKSDSPLYLWGQVADDVLVTSQVQKGTKAKPEWTLLGNPKTKAFDLYSFSSSGQDGDEIWLAPNGSTPLPEKLVFNKEGQLCTVSVKQTTTPNGKTITEVVYTPIEAEGRRIEPGTGFWYMSVGGAPKFNW